MTTPTPPANERVRRRTVVELPTQVTNGGVVSVSELRAFVNALTGEPGDGSVRLDTDGLSYEGAVQ